VGGGLTASSSENIAWKRFVKSANGFKPGAPFVMAHISFPQTEPERSMWIARHAAWGVPDGTNPALLDGAAPGHWHPADYSGAGGRGGDVVSGRI
jgi:hypothetical protein